MVQLNTQQQPSFFIRGPSPLARLTFFAAVSLVLMGVDARLHYLVEVRQGFVALMHPLEVIATSPIHLYRQIGEHFTVQDALLREAKQLREQNMRLSTDLQRLPAMQVENEHLRQLLEARQSLDQPARMAEIVHAGRDPFVQKVVINLGSQQNVSAGQAVVDGLGVIGQVTRAYPFSSEVTLITDRELAVPVQVERNGLRAIVFGHGRDNMMDVPYLPVNVDIKEGDRLVTSGIDGTYPMGLAVAMVARIERNVDSPFAHIVCTPVAGTDRHRQVLVLTTSAPQINDLPPSGELVAEKHKGRRRASR
jgi:rod shape-determining protein MreC